MMVVRLEAGIRRQVADSLGSEITDAEWQFLTERQYVAEVVAGQQTPAGLAREIRTLRDSFGAVNGSGQRRNKHGERGASARGSSPESVVSMALADPRIAVLAVLLAQVATQDEGVQAFRDIYLDGELLPPEGMLDWLTHQSAEDRTEEPVGVWLTDAYVPAGERDFIGPALVEDFDEFARDAEGNVLPVDVAVTIEATQIERHLVVHELACTVTDPQSGQDVVHTVVTTKRGALEHLRLLGELLARECRWSESEAVRFVLTGIPPTVRPVTSRVRVDRQQPTSTRITLTIDPALSPREVAEHYRRVRRQVIGTRPRDLSQKHLQLARFDATRREGETWLQRMQGWNHEHPQWAYRQETNFARDCVKAKQRLLRPDYHEPREAPNDVPATSESQGTG